MKGTINELADWVKSHDDIAVVPHVSPDGDALGTSVALVLAFEYMGKRAAVVCADPVPNMYAMLPALDRVTTPGSLAFEPACLLFVDVAALDRAGDRGALSARIKDWALIDHHETNGGFAPLSVVDGQASASGLMALRLIDALGVPLNPIIAVLLYAAISTDTGNFSFGNTTPEAFSAAAQLLETGFDLAGINERLFRTRSVARTRLLGAALSAMELYEDGRLAVARIPQTMFAACGADYAQTEGIINMLVDMEGVEVAMTVEARGGGQSTKFSLRSTGGVDVAAIARTFGGGGHTGAAGMNLEMPLDDAAARALDAVKRALNA